MWLANAISAIGAAVRSPVVRWSALGVVGFGTAIGSVAYTDVQFQKEVDRQTTELEVLTLPPHCETPAIHAVSDCGREVAIREATELRGEADLLKMETTIFTHNSVHDSVIRCQPASDRSNCHGWVFTGGRFWIAGTEVDNILVENGYRVEREPKPGDLVLYRSDGNLLHTAIVRYVTEGQPVLVEGKWGCTGVYLHAVDKSIYGTGYQFYRSPRLGHVLAGLQAAEVNPTHGSPHIVYDHTNPDEFTD